MCHGRTRSLGALLERSPARVQVIATSSVALYELVAGGRFPAHLYYRLNTILLTDDREPFPGQLFASLR